MIFFKIITDEHKEDKAVLDFFNIIKDKFVEGYEVSYE